MTQPPHDEFAMTDPRQVLAEGWRLIKYRKWHFVFGFLIAGTLAFAGSFLVPRKYSATTILKRESDPALATMMGKSWSERYGEIRQRMSSDLTDVDTIKAVLAELHRNNGQSEASGMEQEAKRVAEGLSVKSLESSASRDVVALSLTLPKSDNLIQVLQSVRDRYVEKTRKKTIEILHGLDEFFVLQSERSRSELDQVRKQVAEYEVRYPGVNPEGPDPNQMEQAALAVDRLDAERQRETLEQQYRAIEEDLARLERPEPLDLMNTPGVRAGAFRSLAIAESDDANAPQIPNPAYVDLQAQKEKLTQEINDNKTLKGMTERHPTVAGLKASLDEVEANLRKTSEFLPSDQLSSSNSNIHAERLQLRKQLTQVESKIKMNDAKLGEVQRGMKRIEHSRLVAAEHRESFIKLRQKADRVEADLNTWQQNIDPIRRLLTLENSNRSLHFTALPEIETSGKAVYPAAWMVLSICLGVALVSGILCIACAELFDRSCRTAKHLASLGVPVIKTIDEIMTQDMRKRRFLRRMILVPTLATCLLAALLAAGSMAYRSLDQTEIALKYDADLPQDYSKLADGNKDTNSNIVLSEGAGE